MRILFVGPLPDPVTGQSLACKVLLDHLVKTHQVDVVNLSKPTLQGGAHSLFRLLQIFFIALKIFVLSRKADVIYFTISESLVGNFKDILIYLACLGRLNRLVVHLHGGAGMTKLFKQNAFLRGLNGIFLRRMAGVIVLGDRLKRIYIGVVPEKILYSVPNFSQDDIFVTTEWVHQKFSCINPLRLLFLSNLLPGKGHEELLEAIALLPSDIVSRVSIDFAGGFDSPKDEQIFREKVSRLGLPQVRVCGLVKGQLKLDLLSNAHLFCLPTYYPFEGQPISILEAYASGCCVLTTDHSGIFDVFEPGVNGFQVSPGSAASIGKVLKDIIQNPDVLSGYALNNLEQARLRYRVSSHVHALENILAGAATNSGS